MSEYREFWIKKNVYVTEPKYERFYDVVYKEKFDSGIHVIEYSAYIDKTNELASRVLAMQKELEQARTERDNNAKLANRALEDLASCEAENEKLRAALEAINREELSAQRPGSGYSRSATISFNALKPSK